MRHVEGTATVDWQAEEWLQRLIPSLNKGLTAAAEVCANKAQSIMGASPSQPDEPPGVDTGEGRQSIRAVSPDEAGTPLKAWFGTPVMHMRHMEFGAFVKAKNAKYLTIPVDKRAKVALRRAGSVRNIPGLKFIPPKSGARGGNYGGVLVWGKGGGVAFVLKKEVYIHPRPWAWRSMRLASQEAENAFAAVAMADAKGRGLLK